MRRTSPTPRRRLGGLVLVLGLAATSACSTSGRGTATGATAGPDVGGAGEVDVCAVLTRPAPPGPDVPATSGRIPLGRVGDVFLAFAPTTLAVYFQPSLGDRPLSDFAERISARRGAIEVIAFNQADSHEEFKRMFAGAPKILESVSRKEQLPASVRVRVDSVGRLAALRVWASTQPEVLEALDVAPRTAEMVLAALGTDGQRDAWRSIAEELRALDAPWAVEAAEVVDHVLETGTPGHGTPAGDARLTIVQDGVTEALDRCG